MKKKLFKSLLITLLIGILSGTVVAYAVTEGTTYQMNENGVTYGHINPKISPINQDVPQLIAAIGLDGEEGYVYEKDLNGEQPQTPEEAVEYMENLEKQISRAKVEGQEYLYYIPLYAEDGVTVIGEFGISYP